ncbi:MULTISPECIES: dTDP-4-dehydrorhamnose reductase [Hydrogenophaga]|uniref:dTDP-4-dehydrorhamnose reductase n=1 Tax=Hydrogenophaga intermedia TaxID=65786 RepID=A0A1L1PG11_HYDIT|nr:MULTISPECIES: dTDP-4-dehydrorhamnose reductase [Hydrogenophaga]AOS81331.1 dTDP-4-dehydrorhamnose reductase [Hydrogenophaga sp. PBC]TMU74209.1 dTDP-4-dehydrorhamnose reductase [Hydrogenophaga intermedia]CDN87694.1 dTDP-4-dehydrorhamnose reductase [Hydrogenophaga intermedia]
MRPILLLGSAGQLGWELQRSLAPLGHVVPLTRHDNLDGRGCGNLLDPPSLRETVLRLRPAAIVNAAAYTAVDRAEQEPDVAHTINAVAPGVLAEAATEVGALVVHFSTDYVFDGSGKAPWTESALTAPCSVYGRTKLDGEERVRAAAPNRHLIFRSSWVYAARGNNFAKTMLRLAGERDRLTVIDDQIGTPTGADLIADVTAHALRQALRDAGTCGTYHLAARGETSWFGYARFVLDTARELSPSRPLKVQELVPIPTSAYPTAAQRPLNSRLDTRRLCASFGLTLPDWRLGVRRMLQEIL